MSALSRNGNLVNVGDQVTIMGSAVSVTGAAPSTAAVVIAEAYDGNLFTAQANDCSVPTQAPNTAYMGAGVGASNFNAGSQVNVNGKVTAISGSGQSAQLTVTLDVSQLSITCTAGACNSNAA
jgi:hypothetical protein